MTRVSSPFAVHARTQRADGPLTTSRFVGGSTLLLDPKLDPQRLAGKDADHNPVLFSVGAGKDRIDALSWNVCFRYRFNEQGKHFNNGFGRSDESVAAYQARLARTAGHIEAMVSSTKPAVVCLQETPKPSEPSHALFERELKARVGKLGYSVLSSGDRFMLVRGDGGTPLQLPPGLARQGTTMDPVLLDDPAVIVVNMHLSWDARGSAEEAATKQALRKVVDHLRGAHPGVPILFAGDANRVPASVAASERGSRIEDVAGGLGTIVAPPGPTNLRFNHDTHKPEMSWADFAVFVPARP